MATPSGESRWDPLHSQTNEALCSAHHSVLCSPLLQPGSESLAGSGHVAPPKSSSCCARLCCVVVGAVRALLLGWSRSCKRQSGSIEDQKTEICFTNVTQFASIRAHWSIRFGRDRLYCEATVTIFSGKFHAFQIVSIVTSLMIKWPIPRVGKSTRTSSFASQIRPLGVLKMKLYPTPIQVTFFAITH